MSTVSLNSLRCAIGERLSCLVTDMVENVYPKNLENSVRRIFISFLFLIWLLAPVCRKQAWNSRHGHGHFYVLFYGSSWIFQRAFYVVQKRTQTLPFLSRSLKDTLFGCRSFTFSCFFLIAHLICLIFIFCFCDWLFVTQPMPFSVFS